MISYSEKQIAMQKLVDDLITSLKEYKRMYERMEQTVNDTINVINNFSANGDKFPHTKKFGVYYNGDGNTLFLEDFDTLQLAKSYIKNRYNIKKNGTHQVDIITREIVKVASYMV